ncbi:peptidoglycan-binding protein [Dactylosporangium sp. NPDC049525]|uniref:peptidoglycan-binding protein n=1 Tax=Dactylosporangium sp. NPDC049525 TaxID=3154730 RepID=UPI003427043D
MRRREQPGAEAMSRRIVAGVIGGAATVAVAVLATLGYGGRGHGDTTPAAAPPKTAPVTRSTLVDAIRLTGKLGYGAAEPFAGRLSGTLTKVPAPGTVLRRGDVAYRVDDQPVVVLLGELPAYRDLAVNVKGPDVKQFEENLRALGYRGFTVDTVFDSSTAVAVKRWQQKLGLAETGVVELGRVTYVAAPVRVAEQKQHVGEQAAAGTPVLTTTGTTRTVAVELESRQAAVAKVGTKVQVRSAAGKPVEGSMTAVTTSQDEGQRKTVVTVSVADQSALSGDDGDTVDVTVVRAEKKDVLTVPIVALLAVGDGYGVEVFSGGARRTVPVTVGMFAQGRAEVSAPGLVEGTQVGVAGQ